MANENQPSRKEQLLDQLLEKDPEIRDQTLKALQKLNPETVLPEVRADEKIEKAYKKAKDDALAEFDAKQKQRDFEAGVKADRDTAVKRFGLSEEEVGKVEKLMTERKIGTYEAAADYFRLMTKPAEPTPTALLDTSFQLPDRKEMADLWKDPRAWSLREAGKALNEIRAKRGHE